MSSDVLQDYEERQNKKAIKMLKELEKRIKRGELRVLEHGYWEATSGKWNFHIVTREADDFRPFTDIP